MAKELVWVLPCLIVLQDRVEDLLLGPSFADVFGINYSGVDIAWIFIEYNDFIDTVDGGCACDSSDLDSLVIGLLGIESPASRQSDSDGPVATFGWCEKSGRFRSINVVYMLLLGVAFAFLGRTDVVVWRLMHSHGQSST